MPNASSLKPITVRLPEEDFLLVKQEAEALGVSVGVFLRILVRQSLRYQPEDKAARRATALRHLSHVLSREAEAAGITEEEALRISKAARKRLSQERISP